MTMTLAPSRNRKAAPLAIPRDEVVAQLRSLQRKRSVTLKSRNMQSNRLQAVIAGTLGYHSGMADAERKRLFADAAIIIKAVADGEQTTEWCPIIRTSLVGIDSFNELKTELEGSMRTLAKALPLAWWVEEEEQRGFDYLSLAIIVGEAGDLCNYAGPAKLWRRFGCAPWTFDGQTQMGSTWKFGKFGKLPAAEWEAFGYCPRRRSIMYVIGECLMKANKGPYRARYAEAKAKMRADHPDEKVYSNMRCHRHGLLLAAKMLLKRLWVVWNGK